MVINRNTTSSWIHAKTCENGLFYWTKVILTLCQNYFDMIWGYWFLFHYYLKKINRIYINIQIKIFFIINSKQLNLFLIKHTYHFINFELFLHECYIEQLFLLFSILIVTSTKNKPENCISFCRHLHPKKVQWHNLPCNPNI